MDSLKRVINTIEFKYPDRYPIMHAVLPAGWMKYGEHLYSILKKYPTYINNSSEGVGAGQASAGYEITGELAEKFVLADDFIFVEPRTYQFGKVGQIGYQSDEWGCIWKKNDPGIAGQVVGHPLTEILDYRSTEKLLKTYNFPNPNEYWRYDISLLKKLRKYSKSYSKYFLAYIGNLFELLQWLFGYENLLINIHTNPAIVKEFIDRIVDYNIATMKNFYGYSINGVVMHDDWGTQRSLMINPSMWRKYFKSAYKEIIGEAKKLDLHFHFHTDGNTIEIIEDLIEIGVDVINPQLSAIDLEKLSSICRGRVCIRTDIDRQYILPYASPREVEDYIKRIINLFGTDKGGLILSGEINSDAKLENVEKMYMCFEEYGVVNNQKSK